MITLPESARDDVRNVVPALVIVQWALYARTARGVALADRLGLRPARIIVHHILPDCTPSPIVIATLEVAHAISLEATLSFLGLGLPVTQPSLGLLISNGFDYLLSGYPWSSVFPLPWIPRGAVTSILAARMRRRAAAPKCRGCAR